MKELVDLFAAAKDVFTFDGIGVSGIRDGKSAQAAALVKRLESALIKIIDADKVSKPSCVGGNAQSYIKIVTEMENNIGSALNAEQIVRKYANAGAMELYNIMRVKRAGELLQAGNSVKDVAYTLGFANPYYFSASFKKHTGVSPSKWICR